MITGRLVQAAHVVGEEGLEALLVIAGEGRLHTLREGAAEVVDSPAEVEPHHYRQYDSQLLAQHGYETVLPTDSMYDHPEDGDYEAKDYKLLEREGEDG